MQELAEKTLSQIVTSNFQTARVFERNGLDFCCKGKRSLISACEEKQISVQQIIQELNQVIASGAKEPEFNNMSLTELAEYIVRVHHRYVKTSMPEILNYLLRVATKHGDHFPYMKEVLELFNELKGEMEQHMVKEEKILFPRIKIMDLNLAENSNPAFLSDPIQMMEEEHDHAGNIMERIRTLTQNYTAPEQACTTFRLTLDSLKAFEEDLHQHVHLENNILFPKAIEMFSAPASCSL